MTEIEHLFVEVKRVIEKSAAEQKERRERGELFNIFDVLNVSTSEVRTHSAFLAELLNPQGSHGLDIYPLVCFKDMTDKFHPLDFDLKNAMVYKERSIGRIDEDYNTGGQIDIIVESGNQAIIIENKIYAGDQKKQLLRYYRYAQRYSSFVLLYLTLDGHLPQKDSYEDLIPDEDFYCISYKEHIISFLNLIMTKAYDKPLVRETTIQYKHLLEELTHTTMAKKDKDELLEIMYNHSECAVEIIECRDDFLNNAVREHLIPQIKEIADNNGLTISESDIDSFLSKKKWTGIDFQKEGWTQISFRLEFDDNNWKGLFGGVCWKDHIRKGNKGGNLLSCLEGGNDLWVGGWRYLTPRTLDYSSIPYIINKTNENSYYQQIDNLIKSVIKEITNSGREA